jgi:hypothetical protein
MGKIMNKVGKTKGRNQTTKGTKSKLKIEKYREIMNTKNT